MTMDVCRAACSVTSPSSSLDVSPYRLVATMWTPGTVNNVWSLKATTWYGLAPRGLLGDVTERAPVHTPIIIIQHSQQLITPDFAAGDTL